MIRSSRLLISSLRPEEAGEVLHPLEVADGDTAGVGQHVRNHVDAVLVEDVVGLRRRRTVRAFEQDPRLDPRRVALGDLLLQRRRNQEFGLDAPEVVVGDPLRIGVVGDRLAGILHLHQLADVEPAIVADLPETSWIAITLALKPGGKPTPQTQTARRESPRPLIRLASRLRGRLHRRPGAAAKTGYAGGRAATADVSIARTRW
jgi:hypothetical protein